MLLCTLLGIRYSISFLINCQHNKLYIIFCIQLLITICEICLLCYYYYFMLSVRIGTWLSGSTHEGTKLSQYIHNYVLRSLIWLYSSTYLIKILFISDKSNLFRAASHNNNAIYNGELCCRQAILEICIENEITPPDNKEYILFSPSDSW